MSFMVDKQFPHTERKSFVSFSTIISLFYYMIIFQRVERPLKGQFFTLQNWHKKSLKKIGYELDF
jgi:hypothetical protein